MPDDENQKALVKRIEDAISLPSRSLLNQKVLSEDDYTNALSHIIRRDFFPSLHESSKRSELIDAYNNQDDHAVRSVLNRLHVEAPDDTTPMYEGGQSYEETEYSYVEPAGPKYLNMSLDQFQNRYTSEDNASFAEINKSDNDKRRERYRWAYDSELKSNQKQLKYEERRKRLVDSVNEQVSATGYVQMIDGPSGKPGNTAVLVESEGGRRNLLENGEEKQRYAVTGHRTREKGKGPLIEGAMREDKSLIEGTNGGLRQSSTLISSTTTQDKTLIQGTGIRSRDSITDTVSTPTSRHSQAPRALAIGPDYIDYDKPTAEIEEEALEKRKPRKSEMPQLWKFKAKNTLMYAPSRADDDRLDAFKEPKNVSYDATRFTNHFSKKNTRKVTRGDIHNALQSDTSGSETPRVAGFSFVDPDPTPIERMYYPEQEMGDDATSKSDVPAFQIEDTPTRELLAHKLAGKARTSLKSRFGEKTSGLGLTPLARVGMRYPTPSNGKRADASDLTPAARHLLTKSTRQGTASKVPRTGSSSKAKKTKDTLSHLTWTPR